ncbi:MAG: hypothetical protein QNJ60_04635 [Xenococcaceae cyanobacterium MO_188.B19]|nr:hypothetical protein [Xenococcaceae cyanobacterium MO_188.B19]
MMTKKPVSVALVGSLLMVMGVKQTAEAANFNPEPLFVQVESYNTTVSTNEDPNGDPTVIFFPIISKPHVNQPKFPLALLLPGSRVEAAQYSEFAQIVASYGFTVIVPERIRSLPFGFTGLLPEASQITDVFEFMLRENSNPDSPIVGTLDTDNLVLLGHSFGGAVGLGAIDNSCTFPLCEGEFQRPSQLKAGAFFGSSSLIGTGQFFPIRNQGIPLALVRGSLDGLVTPGLTQVDYDSIQDPPKTLITVNGANHYGITNINNPFGARTDPNNPSLGQAEAIETIARWSALFLRAYALDDDGALNYVNRTGAILDENVTVISQVKTVPEVHSVWSLFLTIIIFSIRNWHSGNPK